MEKPEGRWLRLCIGGVVSLKCRDFQAKLEQLEHAEIDVVIDLNEVQAMDSAAIGALMRIRTKREKRGYRCWFEAQLPGLRRILHSSNAQFASGVA
jgi:anti-anti-sigma regulatory factor